MWHNDMWCLTWNFFFYFTHRLKNFSQYANQLKNFWHYTHWLKNFGHYTRRLKYLGLYTKWLKTFGQCTRWPKNNGDFYRHNPKYGYCPIKIREFLWAAGYLGIHVLTEFPWDNAEWRIFSPARDFLSDLHGPHSYAASSCNNNNNSNISLVFYALLNNNSLIQQQPGGVAQLQNHLSHIYHT